ncbi:MAG: hypothetical protein DWP97_02860 [Calditrichaeota bacterium]|nr:MAG: hypothetical protein DWP97_02860 [Calditrichota bacterium]
MINRSITLLTSAFILFIFTISCNDKKIDPNNNNLIISDFPKEFSAPYLGQSPDQFVINVSNSGDTALEYSFTNSQSWLKLLHSAGATVGTTPDSLYGIIQISAPNILPIGVYYDTIVFTCSEAANSPVRIPIVLHIGSEMKTTPNRIEVITTREGNNPPTEYFSVISTTSEEFDVSLLTNSTHLQLTTSSVNSADSTLIPIDFDISGLPLGVFTDTIYLTADSVLNSPFSFLVDIEIVSWLRQYPPISNNINDIVFKDSLNGWAVGDITDQTTVSGFIFETNDGGKTWESNSLYLSNNPDADSLLGSVSFVGDNGWVVGTDAIILHTSNNGSSWSPQTAPVADSIDFSDVFFVDANSGWIVGDTGIILHTSNGGLNWEVQTSNVTKVLNDCYFLTDQIGWVCGNTDIVLTTIDGGTTWNKLSIPVDIGGVNSNYDFRGIVFTDQNNGYVVGKLGIVLKTIDGGTTWTTTKLPEQKNLLSIDFADAQHGWICGSIGAMYYTDNGGQSWTYQSIGSFESLNTLEFINETTGWVAGYNGTIFHTTSAGL